MMCSRVAAGFPQNIQLGLSCGNSFASVPREVSGVCIFRCGTRCFSVTTIRGYGCNGGMRSSPVANHPRCRRLFALVERKFKELCLAARLAGRREELHHFVRLLVV